MNMNKLKAMKKIKQEFKELNSDPISNIGVTIGLPNEDNIFEWQCSLLGPKDTSYSGGLFFLRVNFPEDYPEKPPEVCFKTPIYHVNINFILKAIFQLKLKSQSESYSFPATPG